MAFLIIEIAIPKRFFVHFFLLIWADKFLTVISTAVALLILLDNILHPSCVLSSDHNQLNSLGGNILAECSATIPAGLPQLYMRSSEDKYMLHKLEFLFFFFYKNVLLYLLLLIDLLKFPSDFFVERYWKRLPSSC